MATTTAFQIQKPRIYKGFTDAKFKESLNRIVTLGGCSPDELSRKLFPNQETTIEGYLKKHLPYTVYLLGIATRYSPLPENVAAVLAAAARSLLDDHSLRRNFARLFRLHSIVDVEEKDEHVAAALVRSMELLDYSTWFFEPQGVGEHLSFSGRGAGVLHAPPATGEDSAAEYFIDGEVHYVPFIRVERTAGSLHQSSSGKRIPNRGQYDVVKVSTEENPLWGQMYIRLFIEKGEYLIPGSKNFRRLEVLRLLARNEHFRIDSNNNASGDGRRRGPCGRRHFPVPVYSYVDQGNAYLLLHPPVPPLDSGESIYPLLSDGACTLAQFLACRPRWWTSLGREEKVSRIFGWMTCLASTLSLFHSLKVSHGRIGSNKVVLVHDDSAASFREKGAGEDTMVFIIDWHVPPVAENRHRPPVDSMNKLKSSIGSSSRGESNTQEYEALQAERSRQQDIKDLGEVFGDLLLLLLGTSQNVLARQRRERISLVVEVKSRDGFRKSMVENEYNLNRGFYPPLPIHASAITVVDTAGPKMETSPNASTLAASTVSEAKTDISEWQQTQVNQWEPASRLFSSIFSKRSSMIADSITNLNTVSNTATELQQQLKPMLPIGFGKSRPQFAVSWWVEELSLMYPSMNSTSLSPPAATTETASKEGEEKDKEEVEARERCSVTKTAEFLGNKLLPLLAIMVSSEPLLRPKSREVWTTLSAICEDYLGNESRSSCCRCSVTKSPTGESEEEVIWDEITETVLRDLYERGIADEEEEAWEGLGSATSSSSGKFDWRRIGRVGEGVTGECLLDLI